MGELLEVGRRLLGNTPHPSVMCRADILTWALRLSEQDIESPDQVVYAEPPLRMVTTRRISWYAGHYVKTIIESRFGQRAGSWEPWTGDWLADREEEALEALENLRRAIEGLEKRTDDS